MGVFNEKEDSCNEMTYPKNGSTDSELLKIETCVKSQIIESNKNARNECNHIESVTSMENNFLDANYIE